MLKEYGTLDSILTMVNSVGVTMHNLQVTFLQIIKYKCFIVLFQVKEMTRMLLLTMKKLKRRR